MSRVLMLVEGPTERAIVDHVFAPVLGAKGLFLFPKVVGKPGHKGGNKFAAVRRELKALYNQEPNSIVTMLFDYYGLPDDWPGLREAKGKRPYEIPCLIESAIAGQWRWTSVERLVRRDSSHIFSSMKLRVCFLPGQGRWRGCFNNPNWKAGLRV